MTLQWTGFTSSPNGMTATGLKGRYRINWLAGRYILTGFGHDDLPMLALNAWGRQYETLEAAQTMAEGLEAVRAVEPEVSGA